MSKSKRNFSRFLPFAFADRSVPSCTQARRPGRGFEMLEDRRVLAADITFGFDDGANQSSTVEDGTGNDALLPYMIVNGDLTNAAPNQRTIALTIQDGSAAAGLDYNGTAIVLQDRAYDNEKIFLHKVADKGGSGGLSINPFNDNLIEGDESFFYTLSESSSELNINGKANGTLFKAANNIIDDDSAKISVTTVSIGEEGGAQLVTVTLDTKSGTGGDAELMGQVKVTVADLGTGTATPGVDYTAFAPVQFEFNAGFGDQTKTFLITPTSDLKIEGAETIDLNISAPTGGGVTALVTKQNGSVKIADDDTFQIVFSSDVSMVEPGTDTNVPLTATIVFSDPNAELTKNVNVSLNVSGDAESTDYKLSPGALLFTTAAKSGDTQGAVVTVNHDNLVENDEQVIITAGIGGGVAAQGSSPAPFTLTIENDDQTSLSITSPTSVSEGGAFDFQVKLSNPVDEDIELPYSFAGGTASEAKDAGFIGDPDDYNVLTAGFNPGTLSGTIKLIAGQNVATIQVKVNQDIYVESKETIKLTVLEDGVVNKLSSLYGSDYLTPFDVDKTTTIANDDNALVSILSPGSVSEGAGTMNFVVVLSLPSVTSTDVAFSLGAGTATNGVDFSVLTGSPITIPAGQQTTNVTVTLVDDGTAEPTETVTLKIDSVTPVAPVTAGSMKADPLASSATGKILDNDGQKVNIVSVTVNEGVGTALVTVEMASDVANDITFDFKTSNGTATAPADYTAKTGSGKILAGFKSATIAIPIVDDLISESDETFFVTISNIGGIGASLGPNDKATVTIQDNDFAAVSIDATTTVNEGDGTIKVRLTRSGALDIEFDATVAVSEGSAKDGKDYNAGSLTTLVPFAKGQTEAFATIALVNDGVTETKEDFFLKVTNVSDPAVEITNQDKGTVFILDNDAASVTITNSGPVSEGKDVTLTFKLAGPTDVDIVVTYDVAQDLTYVAVPSAEAGDDFAAGNGQTITILKTGTTATTTVAIAQDAIVEGTETFQARITGVSGGTAPVVPPPMVPAGQFLTSIKILDDDTATITVNSLSTGESGDVIVTFTADKQIEGKVTINAASVIGGARPAQATDFGIANKNGLIITGGPGATTTTTFAITADTIVEPDETFRVEVTGVSHENGGAVVETGGDAFGIVTILDDDVAQIQISNNPSVSESGGVANLEIKLIGVGGATKVQEGFSFKLNTVNFGAKQATAGVDYTALVDHVASFPAGSLHNATILVPVTILNDGVVEPQETFGVNLATLNADATKYGNVTNVDPDTPNSIVTIQDDDSANVSISATTNGVEGGANGSFKVTLSQKVDDDVTVTFDRAGTAKAGVDYTGVSTSVVIAKGQTSVSIPVNVINDTFFEKVETVTMTILTVVSNEAVSINTAADDATVNITSDDLLQVTDVAVSGSGWATTPYSLFNGNLDHAKTANSTLPWSNLNRVHVSFNVDEASYLDAPTKDSIALTGVAATYSIDKTVGIALNTATFTILGGDGKALPNGGIGADRLTLTVHGQVGDVDPVTGLNGNVFLNGGVDSKYNFNILPGDANNDGVVNGFDRSLILAFDGDVSASPTRQDINGTGNTNGFDRSTALAFDGTKLPAPPAVAAFEAAGLELVLIGDDGDAGDEGDFAELSDAAFAVF